MALGPRKPASQDDKRQQKQDAEQDVFLREVDDALRGDQLLGFWGNYWKIIVAVLVIGLGGLGGWLFWQSREAAAAGITGEEYVTALDAIDRNNLAGANAALTPLTTADEDGYRAAAMLMQGNIALAQNKTTAAVAAYEKVVADTSLPQPYRDAALVKQTAAQLDTLPPATVISRLKPLAVAGNPWFGSAGEMVALAHIDMKKPELAGPIFAAMAKDDNVPDTIKARARQMAGLLGIDTITDADAVANGRTAAANSSAGEEVE